MLKALLEARMEVFDSLPKSRRDYLNYDINPQFNEKELNLIRERLRSKQKYEQAEYL